MEKAYLNEKICKLGIDSDTISTLNSNNILIVRDLWLVDRSKLKQIGLSDSQINKIKVKMQLNSLDLNKKQYNKN